MKDFSLLCRPAIVSTLLSRLGLNAPFRAVASVLVAAAIGPVAGAGTARAAQAQTQVVVTLEGKAAAPAMTAIINSQSQLVIYPYDWCAWAAAHGKASVPKDASGSLFVFDLPGAKIGEASKFPATYRVKARASGDENVTASVLADCAETRREAVSGSVTIESFSAAPDPRVTGKVDLKLRSKASGKTSRVVGTFVSVDMRACQALLPTPDLSAIPDACQATKTAPSGVSQK